MYPEIVGKLDPSVTVVPHDPSPAIYAVLAQRVTPPEGTKLFTGGVLKMEEMRIIDNTPRVLVINLDTMVEEYVPVHLGNRIYLSPGRWEVHWPSIEHAMAYQLTGGNATCEIRSFFSKKSSGVKEKPWYQRFNKKGRK